MNIQRMIDDYLIWMKKEIIVNKYGEYFELTTPYLDRFNDYLQIYVKQESDESVTLSDDGYIINNLLSSGMSLRLGSKRKTMLDRIVRNYSLKLDSDNVLSTTTDLSGFALKKHLMIQAMLTIDDMFELGNENIKNFFIEDVETFFESNGIYYSRDFSLIGKTGSLYTYEFHFQRTKNTPETFCKTISQIREDYRNMTIFNWIDTKEKRNNEGKLIVIINDENSVNGADIDAFRNYDIDTILFSKRQEYIDLFKVF